MLFPFRDVNPTRSTPVVTYGLVAVNALVFLWLSIFPGGQQQLVVLGRGFIPARLSRLWDPKVLTIDLPREKIATPRGVFVRMERFEPPPAPRQVLLSLLTCMFLHGGWWHLIGNMWFLGQVLEAAQALNLPGSTLHYASGVAWWAHIGGFLTGVLLMPPLSRLVGARDDRRDDEPPPASEDQPDRPGPFLDW